MLITWHRTYENGDTFATAQRFSLQVDGTFTLTSVKLFFGDDGRTEQWGFGPYTEVPSDSAAGIFNAFHDYGD